jgi:hypothetical protein
VDESVFEILPGQLQTSPASWVGKVMGNNSNIRLRKHDVTSRYIETALLATGLTVERLERKH